MRHLTHLAPLTVGLSLLSTAVLLSACCEPPMGGAPPALAVPQVGVVSVVSVQAQRLALTAELPGRTAPVLTADVRPQITGLVQARRFAEGSEVKAGELLYQIDPANYRASVDSPQPALAKAEAIGAVCQQENDDATDALQQVEAGLHRQHQRIDRQCHADLPERQRRSPQRAAESPAPHEPINGPHPFPTHPT